ncbi:MAG: hypothetical protein KME31_30165 [Tolypothrix carrinoi HA7290-LM1]|nr:hypothetical protein [Tolypothrix carrinoi HA7290-LM1]
MSRTTASTDIFQAIADPTRSLFYLKRRLTSIFRIPELPNQLALLVATKIT